MEYVAGFMFSKSRYYVALVRKLKPEWQKGLYNGVGGKIKLGESSFNAMCREFKEEADVHTTDWRLFCTLKGTFGAVYFFTVIGNLSKIVSMEEEKIYWVPVDALREEKTIPNLQWLIPMALDRNNIVAKVEEAKPDGYKNIHKGGENDTE